MINKVIKAGLCLAAGCFWYTRPAPIVHRASRTHAPFFHSSISPAVSIMIRCYTRLIQVVSENHATTSLNKRGIPLLVQQELRIERWMDIQGDARKTITKRVGLWMGVGEGRKHSSKLSDHGSAAV